jgi:GLPGLI family protein
MKQGILLPIAYLFFLAIGHSQDFQGKAVYQSKTSMDMDFGGREMSEEQKKRIQERMKSAFEKTFILTFDRTSATYLEEEKLEQPGTGNGGFRMMGFSGGGEYYKNIKAQTYTDQKEMFGKVFLIKDSLPKLNWVMSAETKQIGNYTCYKATATKPVDSTDFSNFRRPPPPGESRENRDKPKTEEVKKDSTDKKETLFRESDSPKEIEITAWYTLDVPISQGPGEYWGLPGLILEVNAGKTSILCSKIILNAEDKEIIEEPSKGKEVSQKEYNAILTEKMKEMSERFQGGNRGREGGNQIRIRN